MVGSVYVEIENYYVKSLIGWRGDLPLTEKDFDLAKRRLSQFHIVLLSEAMSSSQTKDFLQAAFASSTAQAHGAGGEEGQTDPSLFSQLQRSSNKGVSANRVKHPELEAKKV